VLGCRVLHADETPVALLDPGAGKTRRAYVWAYARSRHDAVPGVVYDFCLGRGARYPVAFLGGGERLGERRWAGILLTDRYGAYDGDDPFADGISMVWPEFVDSDSVALPDGEVPI